MNDEAELSARAKADLRSPLLDWLAAIRGGAGLILACVLAGAALGAVPILLAPPRAVYTSVSTLATSPDLIGLAIAKQYGDLLPRRDRANTEAIFDAMFFESIATSGRVMGAAADRVRKSNGIEPAQGFGQAAALGERAEFDPETAAQLAERRLRFDYKTGGAAIKVSVSATDGEYAREFNAALIDEAARAYGEARRRKHRRGFEEAEARLKEIAGRQDRVNGHLRALEKKEAEGKFGDEEKSERTRLKKEQEENASVIPLLFKLRYLYLTHAEAPVVSISVVNEPSSPERAVRAWGWRAALPPIGAGFGLAFGLLLLAVRMHRASMAEANPARYGAARAEP